MNPVEKALWFIESHFAQELTLDAIAAMGGVSRFYMTRAFGMTTGHSIMRYVRGRRLTEAARQLAQGAPDILGVAIDAGYGSHEAFTRAFREQFGLTPEAVRTQRHLDNLILVEPIKMSETLPVNLAKPVVTAGKTLLLVGLAERYTCDTGAAIPAQWQKFGPYLGRVPGQLDGVAYGVCYNLDDAYNYDYLCGVEVADFSKLTAEFSRLRIPAHRYLVFQHREHISAIRSSWNFIWTKGVPESGHETADAPFFERYGTDFDARTGNGGVELWVPIR